MKCEVTVENFNICSVRLLRNVDSFLLLLSNHTASPYL